MVPGACQAASVDCYIAPISSVDSAHSAWPWMNDCDKTVAQRGQNGPHLVVPELSSYTSLGCAWQL